ncbi:MAG: GIY-YIG nuclease family protein [Polymorphobacter sp.]|uniref:GIY-YIG nuclease family protein n=1 Tax=Polymorphobacter sp. TaxID=1909290 RepID=UPI003A87139A
MQKGGHVYILTNRRQGTLYIGVTADLPRRISEHRQSLIPGFTTTHNLKTLVWYEPHSEIQSAIAREKRLKSWNRAWKINLIEATNPHWLDLAIKDLGFPPLP